MTEFVIFDTNILIDAGWQVEQAIGILVETEKNAKLAVSAITAMELLKQYRGSHGLKIPDALIAATAIVHQAPLMTKNQKDFRFIKTLELPRYP